MNKPNRDELIQDLIDYDKTHSDKLTTFLFYGNQKNPDAIYRITGPSGMHYITDSIYRFAKEFGVRDSNLSNVINGKLKQTKGFSKTGV
ncbi:hypothetical protein [Photobacterium halotolerans]|uniref:DNA endonuclease I-HmuI-like NUMOD-like domain-containing protein n=1 Tax=Photobacterium halotolerans TaxID=265726 RepID=A0A0F5VH80_9GAMM|nr:hypothetical protein [Photobacterium halotolerans]KKD01418.1 hypothetical protein KY46_00890 [Photobacterium halotolerans]